MSRLGTAEGVEFFVATLADHALIEVRCDHDAKTDTPVCNCGVVALGTHPTVQAAKEAWALHVLDVLTRHVSLNWAQLGFPAACPPQQETPVERRHA